MGRKQMRQLAHHRFMLFASFGYIRRRKQSAAQTVEVKLLLVVLFEQAHFIGSEEALQGVVGGQVFVRDLFVIGGMAQQEIFVGAQERFGCRRSEERRVGKECRSRWS